MIRLVDTGDLARYFSMKNESEDANAAVTSLNSQCFSKALERATSGVEEWHP